MKIASSQNQIMLTVAYTLVFVFVAVTAYYKWCLHYWRRKNVPFVRPSVPFGNLDLSSAFHVQIQDIYKKLKPQGHCYFGFYAFASPKFIPMDPELIKSILNEHFVAFTDRDIYHNEKVDPLSFQLPTMTGDKWRNMRQKMTPMFTKSKVKMMFSTVCQCVDPLVKRLGQTFLAEAIDIKELVICYTMDVIGSCTFGINCNSFEDPKSTFRKTFDTSQFDTPRIAFIALVPRLAKALNLTVIPKTMTDFLFKLVNEALKYREETKLRTNDFLQMLIDLKESDTPLTNEQIAAQIFLFFLGGFETSSMTITYCLYELAQNRELQERVRREVVKVLDEEDGNLTYESLSKFEFLQQTIEETLRKYPTASILSRQCTKDFRIPNTDVVIEKGTGIMVPTYALHNDPDFFPEPDVFDPERFSKENRKKIVPYTYLPFGEGPRNCIGRLFGMMQIKVGLLTLLKNFRFTLNSKTPSKLTWAPKSFLLKNKDTIYLNFKRID